MRKLLKLLCKIGMICLVATMLGGGIAKAGNGLKVMASIKPVHSLVAGVMAGVGQPSLIVEGAQSPHFFNLLPSKAREMAKADIIFWMGAGLESSLVRPIGEIAGEARSIELSRIFAGPGEEKHDHKHNQDEVLHGWLDPVMAKGMVVEIAKHLKQLDAKNADLYQTNATNLKRQLDGLLERTSVKLQLASNAKFIFFHDAYGRFEARFGVQAEAIAIEHAEKIPGVRRITELRSLIKTANIKCVFSEREFKQGLGELLVENSTASLEFLDPVGVNLDPGPQLYFQLMDTIADTMARCLR